MVSRALIAIALLALAAAPAAATVGDACCACLPIEDATTSGRAPTQALFCGQFFDTAGPSDECEQLGGKLLCIREVGMTNAPVSNTCQQRKQFFGTGLSAQVEDLGAQGEWPTHPELLDWLASEFRDSGWDVKHMVRLIVLSDTYRQQSNLRPETRDTDPSNRWLASQNPRRLEAEFVRDNALFISGLLNPELGGPSAFPYQPAGYYANIQFPDRDYLASTGDQQYRRGVYAHWQRTFLNPMLANFDAPSREECTASRPVSNTPQQALTLLNDPAFVEASRGFAERLLRLEPREDSARIRQAFELALARPPKSSELNSLTGFLARQRAASGRDPASASRFLRVGAHPVPPGADEPELAAWTELARVILNLQETVTRY